MTKKDYTGFPFHPHALLRNRKALHNTNENRPEKSGRFNLLGFYDFALHGGGKDQSILAAIHLDDVAFAELTG